MRRYLRALFVLAGLFALGVVRTHGGDQFLPPAPNIPEPDVPLPGDPTNPATLPYSPNDDIPLPDFPDLSSEYPLPENPEDEPIPLPDYPADEDPLPFLDPSLFPCPTIADYEPIGGPVVAHSAGMSAAPAAAAMNMLTPKMPFPRRILFRPALEFFPATGNTPGPIPCDPANQTHLIIPESLKNTVYIMDTCPVGLSSRVAVGKKPVNVVTTPDGHALVSNSLDGTISVIDLSTRTVIKTIPLPLVNATMMQPNAIAVAPDGSHAYVSSHVAIPGSFVFILDLNTMSFTGTSIAVGAFPASMALTPDGSQLWVSSRGDSRVDIFDTGTNQLIGSYPILLSTGVAINPTGTRAYLLAGASPGTVTVVDTSTLGFVTEIPVGNFPYAVIVTSTGRHVFVTNALSNSISIIDAKGNKVIRTIKLKAIHPLGLALVANGSLLR